MQSRTRLCVSMPVFEPYNPRAVRSVGLQQIGDWTLKLYGIAYRRQTPRAALQAAARAAATHQLPDHGSSPDHYGVGFLAHPRRSRWKPRLPRLVGAGERTAPPRLVL
jgi:hypothetical protein